MAKKKNITKDNMISWYMEYVLEYNKQPDSVFHFAKVNHFDEAVFYRYFGSFEALEKEIFKAFFDNTANLLQKNNDDKNFDARNKLLSFYYTFFENLTANRSYVVYALKNKKDQLKTLKTLSELKRSFSEFIESLDIEIIDLKEERLEKLQHRGIKESAWIQLLATIKFWLEDSSPAFEKTDIFIEKSINASFDLMNITPFKSVIDLGKFLFKEKIHMN
ncbi:MAG: TetR/AcrR family transcriptional regulator [Flavobacteriaceae bacterium]|nr:MAG: TetR/AcrR family transcriptional regulator [Flavobacteriaceae bacterium]